MFKQPVIFTTFCSTGSSTAYVGVSDSARLKSVLDSKLQEYNESNAMMDLVLFDQAMVNALNTTFITEQHSLVKQSYFDD